MVVAGGDPMIFVERTTSMMLLSPLDAPLVRRRVADRTPASDRQRQEDEVDSR